MKKKWVMMLALAASLMMAVQARADHVRIVTGDYFAPFTGRDLPDGGIMTEIVRRAFEIAGYDHAEIIWRSWRQGYDMTVKGEVEGTFPYAYTPFRARSVLFSEPVASLSAFGWFAKSQERFETIDDLNGAVLCLPLGYAELGRKTSCWAPGARPVMHRPICVPVSNFLPPGGLILSWLRDQKHVIPCGQPGWNWIISGISTSRCRPCHCISWSA